MFIALILKPTWNYCTFYQSNDFLVSYMVTKDINTVQNQAWKGNYYNDNL